MAEHVAHTTDVDAMLESMTVEQFDEWAAKDLIEPIGHTTQLISFIAYALAAYLSGEHNSVAPEEFMPWLKFSDQSEQINNAAAKQFIASRLGK